MHTALSPLQFSLEPTPARIDLAPPKEPLLVKVTEHLITHGVTKRSGQPSILALSELLAVSALGSRDAAPSQSPSHFFNL